ncbi:hypothetical protein MNBD_GAMMA26-555 [hydrothermal vent metagenome]|uniref:Uncharacterized protein n=1 Tax=hydrothermal vent metagenome TaxID=652676 RepID=A0A3B1B2N8_9ZZZZ
MADENSNDAPEDEKISPWQQMMDNPFLLLFIGVAVPTVLYTLWGVMEIASTPAAPY